MQLFEVLRTLPTWVYIVDILAATAIAGIGIWTLLFILILRSRLVTVAREPDSASDIVVRFYSSHTLLKYTGLVESVSRKRFPGLPGVCGLDDAWVERFLFSANLRDLRRLLEFSPEKALIAYLKAGTDRDPLYSEITQYLKNGRLDIVTAAGYCGGKEFDGNTAFQLLQDRLAEMSELSGSLNWQERFFAYKIILHGDDQRFRRITWEGFADPHPAVRIVVCREIQNQERGKIFEQLLAILYNDPVFEVRKTAKDRIMLDFAEAFDPPLDTLEKHQVLHLLELLHPDSKEDENTALRYLSGDDLELRLTAAMHLERCGALRRLFTFNDIGDKEGLERNYQFLKKACEVNVCSFLDTMRDTTNPASLYIAARLLKSFGDKELIDTLAQIVLGMPGEIKKKRDFIPVYRATLDSIQKRGGDAALALLNEELIRYASDADTISVLLQYIPDMPAHNEAVFSQTIITFIKNPDFPAGKKLREVALRLPHHRLVPELLHIIKAPANDRAELDEPAGKRRRSLRSSGFTAPAGIHNLHLRNGATGEKAEANSGKGAVTYPLSVRRFALQILGDMRKPYCVQTVLERMPLLTLDQAREFAASLADFAGEEFYIRVGRLLDSCDSRLRAALISCLPAAGRKKFLDLIQAALQDSEPDVRIASAWALSEFEEKQLTDKVFPLLRDPEERVRVEAARIIAERGSAKTAAKIGELLDDAAEMEEVKISAIMGLGQSSSPATIEVLIGTLDTHPELRSETVKALALKASKEKITIIAEKYLQSPPEIRTFIGRTFTLMGEAGEAVIKDLLDTKKGKQRSDLATILEQTGYVERRVKELMHRSPANRREAAIDLAAVGTESAYRGIIQAIKDPDQEVRVRVVHALEALGSPEGAEILSALQNDPDKRVRKHTHWAVERMLAKTSS